MADDINGPLRNLLPGNIDAWNRVYATVEEANTTIPNTIIEGVSFRSGKIVRIGTETNNKEYRWIGGFANVNLTRYFIDKTDIVNNLTIGGTENVASGELAKQLKSLIDSERSKINELVTLDNSSFTEAVDLPYSKIGQVYPNQFVNPASLWGNYLAKININNKLNTFNVVSNAAGGFKFIICQILNNITTIVYAKSMTVSGAGIWSFTPEQLTLPGNLYTSYGTDLYIAVSSTGDGSFAMTYKAATTQSSFTSVVGGGAVTSTPLLDFSYWINAGNGSELFDKISLFDQIANNNITGIPKNIPTQPLSLTYSTAANPNEFYSEKTNFVTPDNSFSSIVIKAKNAGSVVIGFAELGSAGGTANLIHEVTKTIPGAGEFTFNSEDLSLPSGLLSLPKVFVLIANVTGGVVGERVAKYDIVSDQRAIYFNRTTGLIGMGTYAFNFYLKVLNKENPLITRIQNIENSLGDVKPDISNQAELQDYINSYKEVNLGSITINITSPLTIPSGTKITGVKGSTILKLIAPVNIVNLNGGSSDITFEGIDFDGNTEITPIALTRADVLAKADIGSNNGIYVNGKAKNIFIKNCEFRNFNGAGVNMYRTHDLYTKTFKFTDNVFVNNTVGLLSDVRSEYHSFMGNSFCYNLIGAYIEGGNNFGSSNQFNANGIGLAVSGTLAENDSHGTMVGCSFNHNLSYSIYAININNGFTFSGCHVFEGNICLDNSKGFNFNGGIIAAGIILVNTNASYNIISGNIFFKTYTGGTITGIKTKLLMAGNRFIDGSSSVTINNEI